MREEHKTGIYLRLDPKRRMDAPKLMRPMTHNFLLQAFQIAPKRAEAIEQRHTNRPCV